MIEAKCNVQMAVEDVDYFIRFGNVSETLGGVI